MRKLSLFILGMPRSGTKLLRNLVNNHQDIFIPRIETLFIPFFLKKYGLEVLSRDQIHDIINHLKNSLFYFYYSEDHQFDFKKLEVEQVNIKEFLDIFFHELALNERSKAIIFGDKSPNYIYDIELLMDNYPEAKFLHIVRDPRDYALSINKTWGKNIYRAAYRWTKAMTVISDIEQNKKKKSLRSSMKILFQTRKIF